MGDGSLGVPERAPFDADRGRGRRAERPSDRSTSSCSKAAESSCHAGSRGGQELVLVVRTPDGPVERTVLPVRFVPLLGDEGFGED